MREDIEDVEQSMLKPPSSIHLLNRFENGHSLNLHLLEKSQNLYSSGNWDLAVDDAQKLIGGWLYLHEAKSALSYFGGMITDFEQIRVDDAAHAERIVFILVSRLEGKGKKWRGQKHGMAWSGGLVDPGFDHERPAD